jgi:hypothetical protein
VKNRLFKALAVVGLVLPAVNAGAQQPTTTQAETVGPYSVSTTTEFGVRGVEVVGSDDKYRSDLNYQPGFRIFESSLRMEAEDSGGPFDKLLVSMSGWGGDPQGYVHVNLEKDDVYRFDANVRQFNYFNRLENISFGRHASDYRKTLGDFRVQAMPGFKPFRPFVQYSLERSKDVEDGESTSTIDFNRDEFGVFAPVNYEADTVTFGFESKLDDVNIAFTQGFRWFEDQQRLYVLTPQAGNPFIPPASSAAFVNTFERGNPIEGKTWFTRVSGQGSVSDRVDVSGRLVYSHAESDSDFTQLITGGSYVVGQIVNRNFTEAIGRAGRPSWLFDVGVSVLATDRLTISNMFSSNIWKIEADLFESIDNVVTPSVPANPTRLTEEEFGITTDFRRFANLFELNYDFSRRFSAHAGYRYTDRRIEHVAFEVEPGETPTPEDLEPGEFDNRTNTFLVGFSAKPVKQWTTYVDVEVGETDNAFTRLSNNEYTSVRVRNRVRATDELTLNVSFTLRENDQPALVEEDLPGIVQEFGVDIRQRTFSASADWAPSSGFFLTGGYTYSRLTSEGQIIYYTGGFPALPRQGLSEYMMKDSFGYLNLQARPHDRVGFFAGGRIHRDPGQGDLESDLLGGSFVSSFPYQYWTVEARGTFGLTDHMDLNVGYQYYDYQEGFPLPNTQQYHAHLPYASLRFHFGEGR